MDMNDISEVRTRDSVQQQLADSTREIAELKAALDAHAIVAVTDARGVITRVNDKFCTISKYSRSELIGSTHRIINSGHHPKSFFQNLWRTISSGQVWNGEICNRAKDGSLYWVFTTIVPFLGDDGQPVQYIAIRADITERKKAEDDAQRMAFYDVLTALPNRRLMMDRLRLALASAERTKDHGALILLDLDNFKEVNDTLGHDQGDELLRQVAGRISACVRRVDTVARMGGDEFVIVLSDLGHDLAAATIRASEVAEKLRSELGAPYCFNDLSVGSSPSMGLVMFNDFAVPKDELLKRADMALYRAKAQGRNRVCLFDPSLQAEVVAHARLLADLRRAIAAEEFVLFYQPIVDAQRTVVGYEALIRWIQPDGSMVSPADFIPLAEQTGLILPVGQWVLRKACEQLAVWQLSPTSAAWTVAINVSAKQFRDHDFVDKVLSELQQSGAPASRLRIELTESHLHADLDETIAKMSVLRREGVRFSLDDFGTGYSSLSYLKRLPLDQLKIDKSFVRDVMQDDNDAAIARTVIALGEQLGLGVVAEGVESTEQFEFLKTHGCNAFQGYLFGRPQAVAVCA